MQNWVLCRKPSSTVPCGSHSICIPAPSRGFPAVWRPLAGEHGAGLCQKRGAGLVQVGAVSIWPAWGTSSFTPGPARPLRQAEGQSMEYENLIFELELPGRRRTLRREIPASLPGRRLSLPVRLTPNDLCYLQAAACLRSGKGQPLEAPRPMSCWSRALLRFWPCSLHRETQQPPAETC